MHGDQWVIGFGRGGASAYVGAVAETYTTVSLPAANVTASDSLEERR
jgi:hypothetical protein